MKRLSEVVILPRDFGNEMIKTLTEWLRKIATAINTMLTGDVVINGTLRVGTDTDYAKIEADGTMTFVGAATVWDDMLGDATALEQLGTGVSRNLTEGQVEFTTAANLSDYLFTTVQLTHAWNGGVIYPHLHFMQTTSAMPNFLLQYRWQKMNAAKTTAWTNLRCNYAVFTYPGSGTFHQLANTLAGLTPPSGADISDCVQFRVLRDNANTSTVFAGADPLAATVAVTSFDVHVAKNALGSRSITTK